MLKSIALAAALSLASGVAAYAETINVELQAPVAKLTRVVAGGALWTCEGTTCASDAETTPERALDVDGCKELGRTVGAFNAFGGARGLNAKQLERCNAGLKPASTQTAQAASAVAR